MNKSTFVKITMVANGFLCAGLVLFAFSIKSASGEAVTNQFAPLPSTSVSVISPSAVKSVPSPSVTVTNLILVRQAAIRQSANGAMSLQKIKTTTLPASNSKPVQK
jgi:hypothetical protein